MDFSESDRCPHGSVEAGCAMCQAGLPALTPSWVERATEMIAQNKTVLKELPPSADADIILELEVGIDLLAQLLKAEGYEVNESAGPFHRAAGARLTFTLGSSGEFTTVKVSDGGRYYNSRSVLTVESWIGDGSEAVLTPTIDESGAIASVDIKNPGSGYVEGGTKIMIEVNDDTA